jgi:hypothetical protein
LRSVCSNRKDIERHRLSTFSTCQCYITQYKSLRSRHKHCCLIPVKSRFSNLALERAYAVVFLNPAKRGCTKTGRHNAQATTFYTTAPDMFASCVWTFFMSPLAPRFLEHLSTSASRNSVTITEIRSWPFPHTISSSSSLLHTLFQIQHYLLPTASLTLCKSVDYTYDQHKHQEQKKKIILCSARLSQYAATILLNGVSQTVFIMESAGSCEVIN